jgi:hypothetical protein
VNRRLLAAAALAVVVVLVLVLWNASSEPALAPSSDRISGLGAEASIAWSETRVPMIRAASTADAYAALGYAHALQRTWPVCLWRQTATGRLSSWFGPKVARLDRHTHRLGLARHAREAYRTLPDSLQTLLQAYARGINAGFATRQAQNRPEMLLLEVDPEPWEPWHALAVERLLAWLSTSPPALPDRPGEDLRRFVRTDVQLRRWMHVHSLDRSIAFATASAQDSTRVHLATRLVTGQSAVNLLHEAVVEEADGSQTAVAMLPGSPVALTGATKRHAWSVLPGSRAQIAAAPLDTSALVTQHVRLTPSGADEQLVEVSRLGRLLPFTPPPQPARPDTLARPDTTEARPDTARIGATAPDTTWVLQWPGLQPTTDLAAWNALRVGEAPAFALFDGTGLRVDSSGTVTVLGRPAVSERVLRGRLIGSDAWARASARSLRSLAGGVSDTSAPRPLPVREWTVSDSSAWAAEVLQAALPSLESATPDSLMREAVAYLRNWNASYDAASIGASIFDTWMLHYRRQIGRVPTVPDTTYFASHRRRQAFASAVDTLVARHGPDVRRWRWERVAPDRRLFPVWSADTLLVGDRATLAKTQFAPVNRPGRGHPSTLSGGPAIVDRGPVGPAPTTWTAWSRPGHSELMVRRLTFDDDGVLSRPLLPGRRPAPLRVAPDADPVVTTRLTD